MRIGPVARIRLNIDLSFLVATIAMTLAAVTKYEGRHVNVAANVGDLVYSPALGQLHRNPAAHWIPVSAVITYPINTVHEGWRLIEQVGDIE